MHPLAYAAKIREEEPGEFLVTFPDVPEALTAGANFDEACAQAADALAAALEGYLELNRPWPAVREAGPGEVPVAVDPVLAARGLLAQAMRDQGLSKVDLADRLGRDEKAVRRILAGRGASFEQTLKALRAVGIRPALMVA